MSIKPTTSDTLLLRREQDLEFHTSLLTDAFKDTSRDPWINLQVSLECVSSLPDATERKHQETLQKIVRVVAPNFSECQKASKELEKLQGLIKRMQLNSGKPLIFSHEHLEFIRTKKDTLITLQEKHMTRLNQLEAMSQTPVEVLLQQEFSKTEQEAFFLKINEQLSSLGKSPLSGTLQREPIENWNLIERKIPEDIIREAVALVLAPAPHYFL